MPFISGIELARQVRQVRPMTHIAFLSGYDDFEYAKQAIQYNIISYMLKPLTVKGLVEELKIIRRKIDAQFADFRQEAPQEAGLDARAALLMTLALDRLPRPGGSGPGGGLGPPVRPSPGRERQALLYRDCIHLAERGRRRGYAPVLRRIGRPAGRQVSAQTVSFFCAGQGGNGPAGRAGGL